MPGNKKGKKTKEPKRELPRRSLRLTWKRLAASKPSLRGSTSVACQLGPMQIADVDYPGYPTRSAYMTQMKNGYITVKRMLGTIRRNEGGEDNIILNRPVYMSDSDDSALEDYSAIYDAIPAVSVQDNVSGGALRNAAVGTIGNPAREAPGNAAVGVLGNPAIEVSGDAPVSAEGNPAIEAPGNAAEDTIGNPARVAPGNSAVGVLGNPAIEASGDAPAGAEGNPAIEASGNAPVGAIGNLAIEALGNVVFDAQGNPAVGVMANARMAGGEICEITITCHRHFAEIFTPDFFDDYFG